MRPIVVFDLDDTLYPEKDFVLSGFAAVDRWLQEVWDIKGFEAQAISLFRSGGRGDIFDRALGNLGHPMDRTLINTLVQVYREHRPELRPFPDAAWAVPYFAEMGPIALLTDGYLITQRNKFEALGLGRFFHTVVFSDALGRECWKPSPAPYQKVMAAFNRPAGDFIYVADNPTKDFIAAKQLGWQTVQITRPNAVYTGVEVNAEFRAERQISSLLELKSL